MNSSQRISGLLIFRYAEWQIMFRWEKLDFRMLFIAAFLIFFATIANNLFVKKTETDRCVLIHDISAFRESWCHTHKVPAALKHKCFCQFWSNKIARIFYEYIFIIFGFEIVLGPDKSCTVFQYDSFLAPF